MKICIIGYSGCGKSSLARALGERFHADVLHLDSVHFLPGWAERKPEAEQRIVEDFLNRREAWVIDGNYTRLSFARRMEEADLIVLLLFNRFACLRRVVRRYLQYRNTVRPDMAPGCSEKLDAEFIAWVLWKGRSRDRRSGYSALRAAYPDKTVVIKNQKQLDAFRQQPGWF